MKCSPATQSSNLMTEIDKVIYLDIAVYVLYMYLYVYVYIGMYYLLWCALVHTYIYLHIHFVLIGDSLDCILYFEVLYHCIVININLFIYT